MNLKIRIKTINGNPISPNIFPINYTFPRRQRVESEFYDLKVLSNAIFLSEKVIKNKKILSKIKSIEIPLIREYNDTEHLIEYIFFLIFNRNIEVKIIKNPQMRLNGKSKIEMNGGYTCLFSGGIDSFSGIVSAKDKFKDVVGSFSFHANQGALKGRIKKFYKFLKNYKIEVQEHKALPHPRNILKSRGLNYIIDGLLLRRKKLIVSECGQTMYQPKLSPLDSIAMTTHPKILKITKKLIAKVIHKKIKIILPNENLTKSEIVFNCKNKNYLTNTHSCRRVGFASSKKRHHDGICMGCVLRRIAFEIAELDELYEHDFLRQNLSSKQMNNILSYIFFSYQFLNNFDKLPDFSKEIIETYGKFDLFERASKDTFCALYVSNKNKILKNKILIKWLKKSRDLIPKDDIDNRLAEIKECKNKPNFKIQL